MVPRSFRLLYLAAALSLVATAAANDLPLRLSETGLYTAGTLEIAPGNISYAPQYPLWSDGASKRRWFYLPTGSAIDASDADAWQFPPGAKLWKEFGYSRPVETRFIERLQDGSWRFAAYAWNADGSDAYLVSETGARVAVADAPGSRYDIPSRNDCLACHGAAPVPVLGVSALQLSRDRDTHALHRQAYEHSSIDLDALQTRGLLKHLPAELHATPPRINTDRRVRAVLGYMHGNCGHCHNDSGPLALLDLSLLQSASDSERSRLRTLATLVNRISDTPLDELNVRVVPGDPDRSVLFARLHSHNPYTRMPPLGSSLANGPAIALIRDWIEHDISSQEISP